MTISTKQIEDKLQKILELQKRDDVGLELFKELSKKALKYKEIIDFLKDDDIDNYLRIEEKELNKKSLAEHTGR